MQLKKLSILMIEDDQAQAELIKEMLAAEQRERYAVLQVHYLSQGLEALQQQHFDCALVDLGLPDSKGLETALSVRTQSKETPIVVLTVLDDEEAALTALNRNIEDYLIKGEISAPVLTRSIRYAIQRKAVTERLAQSEERLRLASEAAQIGMWNWDLLRDKLTLDARSRVLFGFAADYGPTYHELLEAIHPADRERAVEAARDALEQRREYSEEMRVLLPDGTVRWVVSMGRAFYDEQGKPLRMDGINMDLSKQKHVEEALRSSEVKFSSIFHAAPSLILLSSVKDGTIIDVNQTALRTLGYRPEELIGRKIAGVDLWVEPPPGSEILADLVKHRSIMDLEVRYRSKAGDTITGLLSSEIIFVGGEECLLMLVKDISDRKLAQERMEQLNAQLQQKAADLEAANAELGAFNYTVAHDLRQPLNVVYGYCQAVEMLCGDKITDDCRQYLEDCYRGIKKMTRLLDSLLEFAKMSRVEVRRNVVHLSAVAQGIAKDLTKTEPERAVTFIIADGVEAKGDPALLEIVLQNLIGNAWKYTGGEREAVIEFGTTETDSGIAYFIRDNGPGFDMADTGKLFAPFKRVAAAGPRPGFGIGLATVERIISRHGGRVWAEGAPGKGATFYFTLNEQ